jgi:hypothetical protein
VELAGFALWALDLHSAMRPEAAALVQPAQVSVVTAASRVADVLAIGPCVESVFLRFGFDRILDPVARRTLARAVTLAQACTLKGVDTGTFIASLRLLSRNRPGMPAETPS